MFLLDFNEHKKITQQKQQQQQQQQWASEQGKQFTAAMIICVEWLLSCVRRLDSDNDITAP